MRLFIIIFLLSTSTNLLSQSKKEAIDSIKNHFDRINQQTDFTIVELNNEDYLEQIPDNGGWLRGFYKNDTLCKIVEWLGLSYASMNTEYYLWNNELIFVYDMEINFHQKMDSSNGFIGFDYSKSDVKYKSQHYFLNGKEISKQEEGNRLIKLSSPKDFISKAETYKTILENKKKNQVE